MMMTDVPSIHDTRFIPVARPPPLVVVRITVGWSVTSFLSSMVVVVDGVNVVVVSGRVVAVVVVIIMDG